MNAITKVNQKPLTEAPETFSLAQLVEQSAKELAKALPDHMKPERIVRIALTCIRMNPKLTLCTPESFLGALFTAAQLGVEPIAGKAHILPFKNRKRGPDGKYYTVDEAQFVLGYPGIVDLFYRHEKALSLSWGVVKEGDEFDYCLGTDAFIKHRPGLKRGLSLYYYVIASLQGGAKPFHVMSYQECMAHGKDHSKTYITEEWKNGAKVAVDPHFDPKSPWATDEDAMCLKTTLIQLAKTLPKSSELQRAIANDEVSREYRSGVASVLDLPSTTSWEKSSATEAAAEPAKVEALPGRDQEGFAEIPGGKGK